MEVGNISLTKEEEKTALRNSYNAVNKAEDSMRTFFDKITNQTHPLLRHKVRARFVQSMKKVVKDLQKGKI